MARNRIKAKGRREVGAFVPLPCSVLNHPNFCKLSTRATKLLMDMLSQLRFKEGGTVNNGDLCVAWRVMQQRGWRSKETLTFALKELLYYGFVSITRQGGRHRCSLYAVTWWAIDECGTKLDVAAGRVPSNDWKQERKRWTKPSRKTKSLPRCASQCAPNSGSIVPLR
jgi:hypothetical protein